MITSAYAWKNGKIVPFAESTAHDTNFTLHYGVGVFEGIRCYKDASGARAIFRLEEHIRRLFDSAKICNIEIPYSPAVLQEACKEVIRANDYDEAYIRPLIYRGAGSLGLGAANNPVETTVLSWEWKPLLGEEGIKNGIRAVVSSFTRGHVNNIMAKGKITGQYVSSVLAKQDALRLGYEDAIMLDAQGRVVEASAENIFMVRDALILTPSLDMSILAGITRDAAIVLARELGYKVVEGAFTRDMLYAADEVFLTGTATEITPVREIDGRAIGAGKPGPITRALQESFYGIVRGAAGDHKEWKSIV